MHYSLLCTIGKVTLYERLFLFQQPEFHSLLAFQTRNSTHQVCFNKHDPLVVEVELIKANSHYAHICYLDRNDFQFCDYPGKLWRHFTLSQTFIPLDDLREFTRDLLTHFVPLNKNPKWTELDKFQYLFL